MSNFFELLQEIFRSNLIFLLLGLWFIKSTMKSIENAIDRLDDRVRNLNLKIGRLEGTVYGKDTNKLID